MESLHVRQVLPVVDMQSSFVVSDEDPFILDDFAFGEGGSFGDLPDFLAKTRNTAFFINMIGSIIFLEILILKIFLFKIPLDNLLLMEGVNCVFLHSDRGELAGEGVILPPLVPEQPNFEGLEEGHDASGADEVQRWLELCDLLEDRGAILLVADFPDVGVLLPGDVESLLWLVEGHVEDGAGLYFDEI